MLREMHQAKMADEKVEHILTNHQLNGSFLPFVTDYSIMHWDFFKIMLTLAEP